MDYYLGFLLGVLLAAIIGVIFIVVMLKYTKTDHSVKCKYDERQQLVRGVGFKYGFFMLLFYNIAASFLVSVEKKQHIDYAALMMAGIFVGVFIYAAYCIWNEGYFSLNENPRRVVAVFIFVGILNFGVGIRSHLQGLLIEDGILTVHCINILCGILVVMLLLVMAAKHICKGKEEK